MSLLGRIRGIWPGGPDQGTGSSLARATPTRAKIFVAPFTKGDRVSECMSRWMTESLHWLREGVNETLTGEDATAEAFRELLRRYRSRPILIVFYGHGTVDGLAFESPDPLGMVPKEKVITSADFKDEMDVQIVAYCCSAALELGRGLNRLKLSAVLGFRDQIDLVFGKPQREKAFSTPIGETVKEVCETNAVDELTKSNLDQSYQAEQKRWMQGGDCFGDTRDLLVATFLSQHRRLLHLSPRP